MPPENSITIGASESPALFGHGSPMALYVRKLNGPPQHDGPTPEWLEWGLRNQPAIIEKYRDEHPLLQVRPNHEQTFHPTCRCMHATPDGLINGHDRGLGVLEVKNVAAWFASDWDDGVPERYVIQVQHQMACTGHRWGAVAVLIGGSQYREGEIERDEHLIAEIQSRCCTMVKRVEAKDPPPADASTDCGMALARLYPLESEDVIQLPGEAIDLTARLDELAAAKTAGEAETEGLRNKIKAMLGNSIAGILPDGRAWRWKTVDRKAYSVDAGSSRQLRLLKGLK
ncbi:hypothetical protein LCGC14_0323130 [marine sediment metagenome]|uniref:YqaJ viral recombinase domain-containing protein n=1 Tax=marine sediment metagenome TaxID=412755 RepID=A0A0F9TP42_9ZZZZ